MNACKSALTQPIVLEDLAKSTISSSINDFSEQEIIDQLEYVLQNLPKSEILKKSRVSKTIKIRLHVDNLDTIQLENILGKQAYDNAIRETKKTLGKNNQDNVKSKLIYILLDTLDDDELKKKLKENGIHYKLALYKKEKIESFGYKHVVIPSQFDYCRSRVLKHLALTSTTTDLNKLEDALEKLVNNNDENHLLSKQKI